MVATWRSCLKARGTTQQKEGDSVKFVAKTSPYQRRTCVLAREGSVLRMQCEAAEWN